MVSTGIIVLSKPTASPETMAVAGPLWHCFAISLTGFPLVKYSLSKPMNVPPNRPAKIAQKLLSAPKNIVVVIYAPARKRTPEIRVEFLRAV